MAECQPPESVQRFSTESREQIMLWGGSVGEEEVARTPVPHPGGGPKVF